MHAHFAEVIGPEDDVDDRELLALVLVTDNQNDAVRRVEQTYDGYRLLLIDTLSDDVGNIIASVPEEDTEHALCIVSHTIIADAIEAARACALQIVQRHIDTFAVAQVQAFHSFGRNSEDFLNDFRVEDARGVYHIRRAEMLEYLSLLLKEHVTFQIEERFKATNKN